MEGFSGGKRPCMTPLDSHYSSDVIDPFGRELLNMDLHRGSTGVHPLNVATEPANDPASSKSILMRHCCGGI